MRVSKGKSVDLLLVKAASATMLTRLFDSSDGRRF